jgi:phosphatidylglycerophosphatase A
MTWWENAWQEWREKQVGKSGRKAMFRGVIPGFILFLATGFFSGFTPYVPGTAGTLMGLASYWLLLRRIPTSGYLLLLLGLIPLGCFLCSKAEGYLDKSDAAPIVLDEWIGYLTSVAALPYGPWTLWGGFFLFRLFDISKPPPIRQIQSLGGGWGVMLDDVLAGIYTNLILRVFLFWVGG